MGQDGPYTVRFACRATLSYPIASLLVLVTDGPCSYPLSAPCPLPSRQVSLRCNSGKCSSSPAYIIDRCAEALPFVCSTARRNAAGGVSRKRLLCAPRRMALPPRAPKPPWHPPLPPLPPQFGPFEPPYPPYPTIPPTPIPPPFPPFPPLYGQARNQARAKTERFSATRRVNAIAVASEVAGGRDTRTRLEIAPC